MKILKANEGVLTNFEVLEFLRLRGATSDPLGCLGAVAPSECKVFDYLNETPANNQKKESVDEFLRRCAKFGLAKAEKLNIINLRPCTLAVTYPIIEEFDARFNKNGGEEETSEVLQEIVDLVVEVLPPPPANPQEEPPEEPLETE